MDSTQLPDDMKARLSQRWTLVVACTAVTLVMGSLASLYTVLPSIAADTGADEVQLTWVVDGYTLTLACLVLPAGALGDRYGRRGTLIVGLLVFVLATAFPLLVHDPVTLIASRAVAGAGAALVMPSTLSLLTADFPPSLRGRAVGIWAASVAVGGAAGMVGAGLLLKYWSWLSVFIGMAAAGAVLLGLAFTIPESRAERRPALDPIGSALVVAGIGLIVYGATEVPIRGWLNPVVIGSFGGGIAAMAGFSAVELRLRQPLLDVRLLARRGFGSATFAITVTFAAMFGAFLLLVQHLQLVLGYAPLVSAFAITPLGGPMIVISLVSPRLTDRFGMRLVTVAGLAILAAGLFGIGLQGIHSDYLTVLWPLLVMSVGLGLCMAPTTAAIVADTPLEKQGVAAAVNDAAREVGAAFGVAVAGSVLAAGYMSRIKPLLPGLTRQERGPVSDSLAATQEFAHRVGPSAQPLVDFTKAALIHGITQASVVLAAITMAGAVLVALWAPGKRP